MQYPHIAFQDDQGGLRVVLTAAGAIVEVAAGADAMGCTVWRRVSTEDPHEVRVRRVEGWKAMCDACGLRSDQWKKLLRAARRNEYPLPLKYDEFDTPFVYEQSLLAWRDLNTRSARARHAELALRKTKPRAKPVHGERRQRRDAA